MKGATRPSEMSVSHHIPPWHHNSEDDNVNHHCENFKSYNVTSYEIHMKNYNAKTMNMVTCTIYKHQ